MPPPFLGAGKGLLVPPGRYQVAVTRRHQKEDSSSSIYTQNNPWEPPVAFESFLQDDESLDDQVSWGGRRGGELPGGSCWVAPPRPPPLTGGPLLFLPPQDLVAWLTVGFLHIPHSEDIPNTSTPGNAVGFFLRPFNFFPEDPSVASRRTVIVRPAPEGGVAVQRWTPDSPGSCVSRQPFSYDGTYSQV